MRAVEGRMEQQRMRRTREPELLSMNIAEAEFSTMTSERLSSTAVICLIIRGESLSLVHPC